MSHASKWRMLAAGAAALFAASGCAVSKLDPDAANLAPPPIGGSAEERLAVDRFRVSFAAEGDYTRAERQAGLLRRAAEITLEEGYDHFIVVNRRSVFSDADVVDSDLGVGVGVSGGSSSGIGVGITLGAPPAIRRGRAVAEIAEIKLGVGPRPDDLDAYDARILAAPR